MSEKQKESLEREILEIHLLLDDLANVTRAKRIRLNIRLDALCRKLYGNA